MAGKNEPQVESQGLAIALGLAALLAAAWFFRDAYETRNADRPLALRLLPV